VTGGRKRRLALMAGESGCRARTRADFLCVQVSCYVQSYSSLLLCESKLRRMCWLMLFLTKPISSSLSSPSRATKSSTCVLSSCCVTCSMNCGRLCSSSGLNGVGARVARRRAQGMTVVERQQLRAPPLAPTHRPLSRAHRRRPSALRSSHRRRR
jgi:hypothetical protein